MSVELVNKTIIIGDFIRSCCNWCSVCLFGGLEFESQMLLHYCTSLCVSTSGNKLELVRQMWNFKSGGFSLNS